MTKEKTAAASKGGAAASPQDSADAGAITGKGTHVITEGNRVMVRGEARTAGYRVSAADFITKRDPDGKAGLQRLVDGGELAKYSAKGAKDDGEAATTEPTINNGAGPSGAQIQAAATGDDPAATAVVDATLTGTEADVAAANGVEADKAS